MYFDWKNTHHEWCCFKEMYINQVLTSPRDNWCNIVNNNCDPIILNPMDLLSSSLSLSLSLSLSFSLSVSFPSFSLSLWRQSGDKFNTVGSPVFRLAWWKIIFRGSDHACLPDSKTLTSPNPGLNQACQ